MILDSSEEESEEESQEEPIDFAAEAAKTAARTLARSASQTYVKTLVSRSEQAVSDPELQAKQLKALAQHARNHPEMASRAAKLEVSSPQHSQVSPQHGHSSPQSHGSPLRTESPTSPTSPASAASVSPASPASITSPVSPGLKSARRAKTEPLPKAEKPVRRQKSSPAPKKKPLQASKKVQERPEKVPTNPSQSRSMDASEGMQMEEARRPLEKTWATATQVPETTMRPSPKAISASSMTQLASATWRGPVETSGNDREMFLRSLSKHESMPLLTFRPRRGGELWVTNFNPAPDTYPRLDESCTSKYLAPRQVSFGFSRKSSRWPANADQKPGPGAHSVVNFERFKFADPVRHSFGGAPRGRPNPIRQTGPGPGAYGVRVADEDGPAVTMTGKYRKRGVLNYDDPGPGAYDPSMVLCGPTPPSVGFATALREDFYPKEDKCIPAPGSYDVTNYETGSDCLAFSMAGKRKRHDLTAHLYAGPGPGFYNHGSTFGYRSTWHAPRLAPPAPLSPPI